MFVPRAAGLRRRGLRRVHGRTATKAKNKLWERILLVAKIFPYECNLKFFRSRNNVYGPEPVTPDPERRRIRSQFVSIAPMMW